MHKFLEVLKETFELDAVDKTYSQIICEAWDSMGQLNLVAELEDAFDVAPQVSHIVGFSPSGAQQLLAMHQRKQTVVLSRFLHQKWAFSALRIAYFWRQIQLADLRGSHAISQRLNNKPLPRQAENFPPF